MPSRGTVAAVPVDLLALADRTSDADDRAADAARVLAPAFAAAVSGHVRRSRAITEGAAAVGLALLAAGGAAGVLALAVASSAQPVDAGAGAAMLERLGDDGDPRAIAWLVAALGPAALAELVRTRPELVGPLDGVPVTARYEANRELARRAGLLELADSGRQILLLDPVRGRAAEVLGDLASAPHVAVVVPGMGNDLQRFGVVVDKAEALRRTAQELDPPSDLAVIAWLGYDSPTVDVLWDDAARTGAGDLVRLVEGVAAVNPTASRTVVGHSYGTLVAGEALRRGLDAGAVVLTGSPGVRADCARDLGDTPVYALRAPGDAVSWSEHFGPDPTGPDFGATRLATGAVTGHGDYFAEGGEALRNVALVAVGQASAATVLRPGWLERGVDVVDDVHEVLTEAPVDVAQEVVAQVGHAVGAGGVAELANGLVDAGQRLASPDLWGDLVGDALAVL